MGITEDIKAYRKNYYALNKDKMIERAKEKYRIKALEKKKKKEAEREAEIKKYIENISTENKDDNDEPFIVPIPEKGQEELIIEISEELANKYKRIKLVFSK